MKVTIAMFYFGHLKNPSNIMKDIFFSISIYSWKKSSLLANIRKKRVITKINLYFFDARKNDQIVLQKFVIFNMITESFLVGKWGTCKQVHLQKRIKFTLTLTYLFWHFSSCLKMKNCFGRISPSHFLQSIFIETSNICFKTFKFLILCFAIS